MVVTVTETGDFSEYEVKIRKAHNANFLKVVDPEFPEVWRRVRSVTMLSRERLYDYYSAITHAVQSGITGDVVEVGTWAGGGCLTAALALTNSRRKLKTGDLRDCRRTVYGFDTFEGHPRPSQGELDVWGRDQAAVFDAMSGAPWAKADYTSVRRMIDDAVDDPLLVELVKGRCEDTLPSRTPSAISVLRLDVDWYEPTLFSLKYLYPRLSVGGTLIIDDFGHHSGARQAFEEYFTGLGLLPRIFHIDYSCISLIKN